VWSSGKPDSRYVALRPLLPSSITSQIRPSNARAITLKNGETVQVVEWGNLPSTIASQNIQKDLEKRFNDGQLQPAGKDAFGEDEYESNGKKYRRVVGNPFDGDSRLSDGKQAQEDQAYWVEKKPVEWLVDEETGIWVKKDCWIARRVDDSANYNGKLEETELGRWMNAGFSKWLEQEMQAARSATQEAGQELPTDRGTLRQKLNATRAEHRRIERDMAAELSKGTPARDKQAKELKAIDTDEPGKVNHARRRKVAKLFRESR